MFFFVRAREKKFVGGNFAALNIFGQVWGNMAENP